MQNLTIKIPDNKLAFFLELIHSLGFVKVENQQTTENVLSNEQISLVEEERTKIKNNPGYLKDWAEARNSMKK